MIVKFVGLYLGVKCDVWCGIKGIIIIDLVIYKNYLDYFIEMFIIVDFDVFKNEGDDYGF